MGKINILDKLAGNSLVKDLAFKQIRKIIKEENISMIVLFVNDKNEVDAKVYNEPMAIVKKSDYLTILNKLQTPADNGNNE